MPRYLCRRYTAPGKLPASRAGLVTDGAHALAHWLGEKQPDAERPSPVAGTQQPCQHAQSTASVQGPHPLAAQTWADKPGESQDPHEPVPDLLITFPRAVSGQMLSQLLKGCM